MTSAVIASVRMRGLSSYASGWRGLAGVVVCAVACVAAVSVDGRRAPPRSLLYLSVGVGSPSETVRPHE